MQGKYLLGTACLSALGWILGGTSGGEKLGPMMADRSEYGRGVKLSTWKTTYPMVKVHGTVLKM